MKKVTLFLLAVLMMGFPMSASLHAEDVVAKAQADIAKNGDKAADAAKRAEAKAARKAERAKAKAEREAKKAARKAEKETKEAKK